MEIRYGVLRYDSEPNLGDEIQSIAAMQYLPRVDATFDRNTLAGVKTGQRHLVIMNGWFSQKPEQSFPPPKEILPVFVSFHLADRPAILRHFLGDASIGYLKAHGPIGCRDRNTLALLRARGVDAYYTKCLTLTFPRRDTEPAEGKIFLVDVDHRVPLPRHIRKGAIRVSHVVPPYIRSDVKFELAQELLNMYRNEARLVVTTRLHCALPCIAMGIPVVFFGDPEDVRFSILKDIGVPIHWYGLPKSRIRRILNPLRLALAVRKVNWNPGVIDVEGEKEKIRSMVRSAMARHLTE